MPYTYEEAVKYIYELPKFTTKHTFEEGREFLHGLGDPDKAFKVIHVAGTNGKGSVCAYMESILMHARLNTGCFISPHLNDIRERIRINAQMCSEEEFADAFNRVYELSRSLYVPTFFEYLFFMAMLIFRDHAPDVVILETGLGGRLDATNLVSDKLFSVITPVGLDHCEYLGNTIEDIAFEKAGIIQSKKPVVYWGDMPGADVISAEARRFKSVEIALQNDCICDIHRDNSNIDFCLKYKYDRMYLKIRGKAVYQVLNAALAVCAIRSQKAFEGVISEDDYLEGVYEMYWPCRMEEVQEGIIVDGAHNPHAITAFLNSVRGDGAEKRALIFGCMRDKDYTEEIGLLSQSNLFDKVIATHIDYERAEDPAVIADRFRSAGANDVTICEDTSHSLEYAETLVEEGYLVYFTGSLYLAGEVRGHIL